MFPLPVKIIIGNDYDILYDKKTKGPSQSGVSGESDPLPG